MLISQMVRLQEAIRTQTGSENFSVVNRLLGNEDAEVSRPRRAGDAYIPASSRPPEPNWNMVPTRREPIMSEAEFEQAIIAMARADAAFAMEMGDVIHMHRRDRVAAQELYTAFVSVASPDRRSLFASGNGHLMINGNEANHFGGRESLSWNPVSGGWATWPTTAEVERGSRFNQIYANAVAEWVAENGEIPYGDRILANNPLPPVRNW